MAAKKEAPARENVVLKKDHRHAGENKKAGDTISVTARQKAWLEDHEVI